MRWSRSLRTKLALLVVTTTVGVSLLSVVAVVSYELVVLRQSLIREVSLLGEITADHGAAALAFDDPAFTEKILGALRVRESILAAAVVRADGEVFASYRREDFVEPSEIWPVDLEDGFRFAGGSLYIAKPVAISSGPPGSVILRSDLRELRDHARRFAGIAAVIALLSCCLALPLALRFQRTVSEVELERTREELEQQVKARTRELARFQERLRDSERLASVGILTAGIAHQINNPVGAILSASEFALLCEEDANAHEVWKEALTRCANEARRCGRIVRSVLHFSRDEQSERWTEDVSQVVGQACRLTASYAQKLGGAVDFHPSDTPAPVLMSPIEMEQVFVNLIRNGLESREGGARVEIRVGSSGDRVSVEIRDNGRGMDADQVGHVFDPFFTTRLIDGGTGLGLSMSHEIVVSHGGSIGVESGRGHGTTFRVELPLEDAGTGV